MYKVKILSIGKHKETWLKQAIAEYTKRLQPILSIEWVLTKDLNQLEHLLSKEDHYVTFDSKGKTLTSEEFCTWVIPTLTRYPRLPFVIGGSEGLPKKMIQQSLATISLSKLTFTHQLVRILIIEQLYRGFEIEKGSQYHK